jgi:hypothetical protein
MESLFCPRGFELQPHRSLPLRHGAYIQTLLENLNAQHTLAPRTKALVDEMLLGAYLTDHIYSRISASAKVGMHILWRVFWFVFTVHGECGLSLESCQYR